MAFKVSTLVSADNLDGNLFLTVTIVRFSSITSTEPHNDKQPVSFHSTIIATITQRCLHHCTLSLANNPKVVLG